MNLWYSLFPLFPFEWAGFVFMQNALLAVIIISPLLAFIGCMIINKQMAFFSDAIGHAGLTGIAIGVLLGALNPLSAMLFFACVLALVITIMRKYAAASADTIIGVIMSFTVALGIVILSRQGGFTRYSRYLIGDILSITPREIGELLAVCLVFLFLWVFFFNRIFMVSINHSLAKSRQIHVWTVEAVFAVLAAVIVTISIQWIGILVISALIILPAAAARNIARSTQSYLLFAVIAGIISGVTGLVLSFYLATATGATIVLVAMFFYLISFIYRMKWIK
jgi:zinc transport system permease protein